MPAPNSQNPAKGRMFQKKSAEILSKHFDVDFHLDYPIPIGNPPKDHKFDLVSEDRKIIGECKNYSWTETGNIPSAKMGFTNEAAFYLTFLPKEHTRFIVMRKDNHSKKNESLAEYYFRTNNHLLDGIMILEIDMENDSVNIISQTDFI
jgi:hypothetical protein